MIATMLVGRAASAKGVPAEKYLADEIARRRKPVTDAAVEAFYESNKSQMQGRPLADIGPTIRRFLEEQQENAARDALVAELRASGPPVRLSLEPPRQRVAVAAHNAAAGPADAPITIVEFSDFQCPFCSRVVPSLKRLRDTYGNRIRIVWKDFPLENIHPHAFMAAEAAYCAGEQGRFWEFHDRLFANQESIAPDTLGPHAAAVGADRAKFDACLASGRHADKVREGIAEGQALGVDSTPTLFVNGRRITGAVPYETFSAVVDEELERAKTK
jgi:protein-disulfide isomerase